MYGMHHFWGMGWWSWIIGAAVLIFLIWFILRTVNQPGSSYHHDKSALDILKERYARGEISKAEFEEKKKDIQG